MTDIDRRKAILLALSASCHGLDGKAGTGCPASATKNSESGAMGDNALYMSTARSAQALRNWQ